MPAKEFQALIGLVLAETLPMYDLAELRQLVDQLSVRILEEIQKVVRDDTLSDPECYQKIERIITILESNKILCDGRHEFG